MTEYFIQETFTSLKGEGLYTGEPMHFIRLAGCNLACKFCDTAYNEAKSIRLDELIEPIANSSIVRVVITGGEPTMQKLGPLVDVLHLANKLVHLETNGTIKCQEEFDWIAVSPKSLDCDLSLIAMADEIKFLVGFDGWKTFIDKFMEKFHVHHETLLYVMPITRGIQENQTRTSKDFIQENIDNAIEYCHLNPEFRYCIQLHKVLEIQ